LKESEWLNEIIFLKRGPNEDFATEMTVNKAKKVLVCGQPVFSLRVTKMSV